MARTSTNKGSATQKRVQKKAIDKPKKPSKDVVNSKTSSFNSNPSKGVNTRSSNKRSNTMKDSDSSLVIESTVKPISTSGPKMDSQLRASRPPRIPGMIGACGLGNRPPGFQIRQPTICPRFPFPVTNMRNTPQFRSNEQVRVDNLLNIQHKLATNRTIELNNNR